MIKVKLVCMLVNNDVVHDSRVMREAHILKSHGYDVTIIGVSNEKVKTEVIGVRTIIVPLVSKLLIGSEFYKKILSKFIRVMTIVFYSGASQIAMQREATKIKADIYHANDLDTLLPAYRASKVNNAKLVYDTHEIFTEVLNEESSHNILAKPYFALLRAYFPRLERSLIGKANAVITVNDSIAEYLRKKYSIEKPIVLLNTPNYTVVKNVTDIRKILGLSRESKIILYQGLMGHGRGLTQLVESAKYLPLGYHLVLMGYGYLKDSLKKQSSELNIDSKVHFLDAVSPKILLNYTASADVGAVLIEDFNLSKRYATPNKMFELLMAGVPMIGSNLPEIKRFITSTKSGVVVNTLDPKKLAQTIKELVESKNYKTYKENALKAAKERYNWEVESQKLLKAYGSLSRGDM